MKRNSLAQTPSHFPVIIIGGGIVGAGCFRDLGLHGIDTLLVDKFDFSSQTSQSSSKMLHGGIRYLENLDFSLVWEALHEKNLWLKLAPHLCYPEKFYLPVYKEGLRPLWMIRAGLLLYDALSGFKNIPHERKKISQILKEFPLLRKEGLQGSGVYSDAIVDDRRLTLECLCDALFHQGSFACNHTSLLSAKRKGKYIEGVFRDELTGLLKKITTENIIFATGPFTDKLLSEINLFSWTPQMALSKGSHLWLRHSDFPLSSPVVLTPKDGRVIFVIPQGKRVLVGTTEKEAKPHFNQTPDSSEIDYLLHNLKEYFPKVNLSHGHILSSFSGLRPLVKDESSGELGGIARNHKIYQPLENAYVIIGGKYTTFRVMASDLVRLLVEKMNRPYHPQRTCSPLRYSGPLHSWKDPQEQSKELSPTQLREILKREMPKTKEDLLLRRLGLLTQEDRFATQFLKENESLLREELFDLP